MGETLALLHELGPKRLALQKQLATCVSSASGLKEEIFTALNTPSEMMTSYHRILVESRDYYKAQLEKGIPDPELRAIAERSLRIAEKSIDEFRELNELLIASKAMSPLLDLAASVYVLHTYAVACAEMRLSHPKQNLIDRLHILILRHRLQSAIREEKDLYRWSKLLWILKGVSKLLNLIPSKIEMLVSMLILKSKLRHCKVESTDDIQALTGLGPGLDEILKEETVSVSVLQNVVNILENILKNEK
jgi:hypothetical protein